MGEVYRFEIGDFECFAVQDAASTVPVKFAFQHVPQDERNMILNAAGYDPAGTIDVSWTCLALNTTDGWVLIDGGLGGAVAEVLSENEPRVMKRLGIKGFGQSGPAGELFKKYNIDSTAIVRTVNGMLKKK